MEKEKLPKARTISNKLDKNCFSESKFNPRIKIDNNLKNQNKKLSKLLTEKLDDHLIVFDDGLKLIISIHELCKAQLVEKKYGSSFVVLSAKMVSLMLGIRQMINSGLSDCIKNLNRPLIESFEVFQACLNDEKLNNSFSNTTEFYDNDKFYWENFAKGKLNRQCVNLYRKLELKDIDIEYLENRKKILKSFLSESIHSSFNASFSSYLMMTIDFDLTDDIYGKITIGYPRLLISLIEEIFIFNNIFKLSIDKNISNDLVNIQSQPNYQVYEYYQHKYEIMFDLYIEKLENDLIKQNEFISEIKKELLENNNA